MNIELYGADIEKIRSEVGRHDSLVLVEKDPEAIVCYGGDGTLLAAEMKWPGVPKVPIRNSRRGIRMLDRPAKDVLRRLAANKLVRTEFLKLGCTVRYQGTDTNFSALNEINVQVGRTSSALRFKLWIDDEPFEKGIELIGDGFLVSTPFGSTAYYRQITRSIFFTGIGIAFKFIGEMINHLVIHEDSVIRAEITRGPGMVLHDNSQDSQILFEGDELIIRRDSQPATLLAWETLKRPSEEFQHFPR